MKASDLLKRELLRIASKWIDEHIGDQPDASPNPIPKTLDSAEAIDDAIQAVEDSEYSDYIQDAEGEIREGTHETGLPCDFSRHYESKSVARKIDDKWVGWTYWYGGGKYGEPESVEWIDNACFLDAKEELRTFLVFSKQ